jgi:type IV secretory pathway VirB3-like protein
MAIIHQSLIDPIMICGLPRKPFFLNIGLAVEFFFLGAWWMISVSIIFFFVARKICISDPEFFSVLKVYMLRRNSSFFEGG